MSRLPPLIHGPLRRLFLRLAHRGGLPLREGNAVALLEGPAWLGATEALIRGAQREICFEMYIWADDAVGRQVLEWLGAALARGVKVRGIVDALGSFGADGLLHSLRQRGGEARAFHPVAPWRPLRVWNQRDHRKLLVVDGEEALAGSANWGVDYDPASNAEAFLDLGLALRGPSVADLKEGFERVWARTGGRAPGPPAPPPQRAPRWEGPWYEPAAVQVITGLSARGRRALRRHTEGWVRQAAAELWIANAYFIPGRRLLRLLKRAARRGVDLRILVPGRSDQPFVQAAGRWVQGPLLSAGARIREREGQVLHAKAAVVDREWAILGSANLDPRSFRHNLELNLAVHHPGLVARVRELLMAEEAQSREVRLEDLTGQARWTRLWQRLAYACRWWL